MVDPKKLVVRLTEQHRGLQKDLREAMEAAESEKESVVKDRLVKFKNDLLEHLELEDKEFYPNYLKKQEELGEDTLKTREFIAQMAEIGKVVMGFLEKYKDVEVIISLRGVFKNELSEIIGTLNVRIESEEQGVYGLYLVM